ncbi:YdcF family protein [Novipirellula artificiosorum]|uniref:DUF218 domain-containing protein n=1 Tax=Novipirellula artificiosorum TaxID=2528016 RepID=A0A5C6E293_9BACT|nr:YdcF family protein [Novipirellula artificiosorum]TWU42604.1 hypothetical protein Poly41_09020 [Novipirellula artificiosorum]
MIMSDSATEFVSRATPLRAAVTGLAAGGIMNGLFAVGTWFYSGAAMAAGCATDLVMPVGLIWTFSLVASLVFFRAGRRWASAAMVGIFLLVSVSGNGWIADKFIHSVEMPRKTLQPAAEPLRAVVMLGGSAGLAYDDVPELRDAGQRNWLTAQLWAAGKAQSVICTGTSPVAKMGPSEVGRVLFESIGIPEDKIFEVPGDNTSQEMKNLAAFFASPPKAFPVTGEIGLVTSAFHMHRAIRLAEAEGIDFFIPLPCGYESSAPQDFSPRMLVPSAEAMDTFSHALKERLARIVGR